MNMQADAQRNAASQQASGLAALGGLGAQAAQPASTIDHATARVAKLIEQQREVNNMAQSLIDRIHGAEPEKETRGNEEGCASGQIHELHRQIGVLEMQTRELMQRLERITIIV
jgi:hypothetical protein